DLPLFVLGGGSNVVVSDEGWRGLALKVALCGMHEERAGDSMIFCAAAGENWDEFVAYTVSRTCAGIECLSGIPGTVGGTPVQNVGAYGQEVSRTITHVRVLDLAAGHFRELSNAECGFAYRTSIFNSGQHGNYIVLEAAYKLKQNGQVTLEYGDLKRFFAGTTRPPTLARVREAVRKIRQGKAMLLLPNDEDCRSAGSFFKNPVVSTSEATRIQQIASECVPQSAVPCYPGENGLVKLSAAWLLEQSGFYKGYSRGSVGISPKHALAIVNRGTATSKDIIAFKNEIQMRVMDRWGVRLQPEPVFVGFETEKTAQSSLT
ncbi:MAG: UDP-N-acetylmuramate dehydrogenase, partial [Candidatus Angelobacter sp.]